MTRLICAFVAAAFALIVCSCGDDDREFGFATSTTEPAVGFCGDRADAVERRIDALLPQMTLAEKIEQMHGLDGGAINGLWHTPDNERLRIPGFRMVDGPRGVSAATGNATTFPVGMARGATWDPALEEHVGEVMGAEARAKGASVLLAPTMNILRHPRWGRAQETYSEDPLHMGRMAVAFIRGVQQQVVASAKHFAMYSIEDTRFAVNVSADERTLREIYLPHFRMAVQEAHVGTVMSAYNKALGHYCAENPELLHVILKGEWGFRGLVESDWWFGAHNTIPAALAGLDIEMPWSRLFGTPLLDAVQKGDVPESAIDEAVRRILRVKFCFRLDENPPLPDPAAVETRQHTQLTLDVEREAIVLLKNAGVLPLDAGRIRSLAVVGPLAGVANLGDDGSSLAVPSYAVTPLDGIRARAPAAEITYVSESALTPADEPAIAAADADIVVVGLTKTDEGEAQSSGSDRKRLDLSSDQEQLILDVARLNPATIVLLEGGSAITMERWVDAVPGILMVWYPGQEGGNAIAEVLFGDTNPSGRVPITFPHFEADLPKFDNVSRQVVYDYYHGYRYLDRNGTEPRFPFGFGLSYTTYRYENLSLSDPVLATDGVERVTVSVANTGTRAGDETVQLYVSAEGSGVDRAVKDLKGFAKVHLEPGQSQAVNFEVPAKDLAYYDIGTQSWRVEPITYTVHVGPHSRDLPLSASFRVAGP
jgi:beta-glucosidase